MSHSVPIQDAYTLDLLVERVDLGPLLAHAVGRQPVGHGQRPRVVADAEVLVAEVARRERHLFERRVAVARGRVVV
jgi:hypothetical protein